MLDKAARSRLEWHCRRGMLELDLILNHFFKTHIDDLNEDQIQQFDQLLSYTDPELYSWLMGYEEPSIAEVVEIVRLIRNSN